MLRKSAPAVPTPAAFAAPLRRRTQVVRAEVFMSLHHRHLEDPVRPARLVPVDRQDSVIDAVRHLFPILVSPVPIDIDALAGARKIPRVELVDQASRERIDANGGR